MRLEITRRAELAVRAMTALAEHAADGDGSPNVKGSDLAERLGTTAAFCGQVMTPLVHAGWVRSDPGPLGGYRLAAPLDALSVLDVIERIDGPTDDGRCVVEGGPCRPEAPCLLHGAWAAARAELVRVLAEVRISSLAAPHATPVELGR